MTGSEQTPKLSNLSDGGRQDKVLHAQEKTDLTKSGIAKTTASQAKEQSDAFLADWWRSVLNSTGLGRLVNDDTSGTVLPWIEKNIDMSRLVLDEASRRQLHEINVTPFQGAADDMPAQAGALAKELFAYSPDAWRNFLRGRLAATLRRLEEEDVKPETRLDVLLQALLPMRGKLGARFMLPVLPVAWRELQKQFESDREPGFYKTWGALADLLTKETDPRLLRWAHFLYATLLAELAKQRPFACKQRVGRDWLEIMEADANNLASVLDDLSEYENTQFLLRISAAAALAGQRKRRAAPVDEAALTSTIVPFLTGVPGAALPERPASAAAVVAGLFNVSRCWLPRDKARDDVLLAPCLGVLSAALAAVAARDEDNKTVVALFNASNLLNRIEDGGYVQQATSTARALINAAGMYWEIKDADGIDRLIAANGHGIDCAVNFLGALADFDDFPAQFNAPLGEFASAVWMLRPIAASEKDFRRMEKSLGIIGIESLHSGPQARENPERLRQTLNALVVSLAAVSCSACLESWRRFTGAPSAETLACLLATVLRSNFCAEYPPAMQRAMREIQAVIELAGKPEYLLDGMPDQLKQVPKPEHEGDTGASLADVLAASVSDIARSSRSRA